ncbi:MAG: hypothetical protein JNL53_11450 [Cyclobacteriaceae bacterium]|nr:hypothetical protein [Cyclobacteriaceae bacterium]
MIRIFFILCFTMPALCFAQTETKDVEQLKKEILLLQGDVAQIQVNLSQAQNKFKRGIIIATIGYSVTIAGGLMLGRKNDDLGKVLLVSGGITGITGTFLMADAFKYLGRAGQRNSR